MVAVDPSAAEGSLQLLLDGTHPHCVVQPYDGRCFPARILTSGPWPPGRPADVVLRVFLQASEADAFFAADQPFTVWADAIVSDEATRGEGLLGEGVILGQESAAADRPLPSRRVVVPAQHRTAAHTVAGRQ